MSAVRRINPMAFWKWGIGIVGAWWLGLPVSIQALFWLMWLDLASGIVAAKIERKLSSNAGFRGACKKAQMWILIGACAIVSKPIAQVSGVDFDLCAAVAFIYCINEVISIMENTHRSGGPVPEFMIKYLAQYKNIKTSQARRAGVILDEETEISVMRTSQTSVKGDVKCRND